MLRKILNSLNCGGRYSQRLNDKEFDGELNSIGENPYLIQQLKLSSNPSEPRTIRDIDAEINIVNGNLKRSLTVELVKQKNFYKKQQAKYGYKTEEDLIKQIAIRQNLARLEAGELVKEPSVEYERNVYLSRIAMPQLKSEKSLLVSKQRVEETAQRFNVPMKNVSGFVNKAFKSEEPILEADEPFETDTQPLINSTEELLKSEERTLEEYAGTVPQQFSVQHKVLPAFAEGS